MRVLVCGGRGYADRDWVFAALDALHQKRGITFLMHGAAPGADSLAEEWAKNRAIPREQYVAKWGELGAGAGPERNQRMLDRGKPDGVVAFPGGSGTADMTRRAEQAGLKVWRPYG